MDWLFSHKPDPFLAMGLIALPCLIGMSIPPEDRPIRGKLFFLFMWSLLSLPLNIALHVIAALFHIRVHPLLAALVLTGLGLAALAGMRERSRLRSWMRNRTATVTAALLVFPIALTTLVYYLKKGRDPFLLFQTLLLLFVGAGAVLSDVLKPSTFDKVMRPLERLSARAKLLLAGLIPIYFILVAGSLLGFLGAQAVFWGLLSAGAGLSAVLLLLPAALIDKWAAKIALNISFGGGSGGRGGGGFSGGGGSSGGAGASGKF